MKYVLMMGFTFLLWSCNNPKPADSAAMDTTNTVLATDNISDQQTNIETRNEILKDSLANTQTLADTAITNSPKTEPVTFTPPKKQDKVDDKKVTEDKLPKCVQALIVKFLEEEKQNPPRKIIRYQYKNKTVYYVPPICCDQYSDLYDANCNLMGHPDGGITGKGDGKFSDFFKLATNENVVWKDKR